MEWNSMEMSTTKCKSFNTYEHFLICKRRVNDLLNRSIEYRMQLLKRDSACRSIYDLTHFLAKKFGPRDLFQEFRKLYFSRRPKMVFGRGITRYQRRASKNGSRE